MKRYIAPCTTIVETLACSLICASGSEERVSGNAVSGGDFGIGEMYIL